MLYENEFKMKGNLTNNQLFIYFYSAPQGMHAEMVGTRLIKTSTMEIV